MINGTYVRCDRRPLLVALALALLAGRPAAADRKAEAGRLHAEGARLFDEGRYRAAIKRFERALARYEHKHTLYALGETYRRQGQLRRSHAYYTRYAALLPPEDRVAFLGKLERLRNGPFKLTISTEPPGAKIELDGKPVGVTGRQPLVLPSVAGGQRVVTARLDDGRRATRRVTGEFGEPQRIRLGMPPDRRPRLEPRRDPRPDRRLRRRGSGAPRRGAELSIGLSAGLGLSSFGDASLEVSPSAVLALQGRLLWRPARLLGVYVDAVLSAAPLLDEEIDDRAAVVTALVGGGLRLFAHPRLWIDASITGGAGLLIDIDTRSFLLRGSEQSERTLAGLALRPALGIGWDAAPWLSIALHPLVVTYLPRALGLIDLPRGMHLLRVELLLSLSWRGRL